MGKQIQLSLKTLTAIAEALFLAFTEEQAAALGGISKRTLARIKNSEVWREIEQKRLNFEKPFRRKVWNGQAGWQGAAWMLERQYASQLSKPELQLQLSTGNTTNNTLVITAEAAAKLSARASVIDAQVSKIVSQRNTDANTDPNNGTNHASSGVIDASKGGPGASGGSTPGHAGSPTTPSLPQNSKISEVSKPPQAPTKARNSRKAAEKSNRKSK
jgi:hypothetical protein